MSILSTPLTALFAMALLLFGQTACVALNRMGRSDEFTLIHIQNQLRNPNAVLIEILNNHQDTHFAIKAAAVYQAIANHAEQIALQKVGVAGYPATTATDLLINRLAVIRGLTRQKTFETNDLNSNTLGMLPLTADERAHICQNTVRLSTEIFKLATEAEAIAIRLGVNQAQLALAGSRATLCAVQ